MNFELKPSYLVLLASTVFSTSMWAASLPALQGLSGNGSPIATAAGDSSAPLFSSDGRYLFFQSNARDLLPDGADQPTLQLYRYDLSSGNLIRVAAPTESTGGALDYVTYAVSANGEAIAARTRPFSTFPHPFGRVPIENLYWLDLSTQQTQLVNLSTNGTSGANRPALLPVISADGRSIAFESQATDIVPFKAITTNGFAPRSIYLRDTTRSETALINPAVEEGAIVGDAYAPSLSGDGSRMAFVSHALPTLNRPAQVHVRDNRTGGLLWIGTDYSVSNSIAAESLSPQLSQDGRWVSFVIPQGEENSAVVIHDLETGADQVFQTNDVRTVAAKSESTTGQLAIERTSELGIWDPTAGSPHWLTLANAGEKTRLSPASLVRLDQSFSQAVYIAQGASGPTPGTQTTSQVFLMNTITGNSEVISLTPTGSPGSQVSILDLATSPDGRWVAFTASDTDLVADDANHAFDLFLYDVTNRKVSLVSRHHPTLAQPIVHSIISGNTSLSADNRIAVFSASDGNRTPNDTNGLVDVFLKDLRTGSVKLLSGKVPQEPGIHTSFRFPRVNSQGTYASFLGIRTLASNAAPLMPRLFTVDLATGEIAEVPDYAANNLQTYPVIPSSRSYVEANFSFTKDGLWLVHTEEQLRAPRIDIRMFNLSSHTNRSLISFTNDVHGVLVPSLGTAPKLSSDGSKLWFLAFDRNLSPTWSLNYRLVELNLISGVTKTYEGRGDASQYLVSENEHTIALVSNLFPDVYDSTFVDAKTEGHFLLRNYGATYGLSHDGRYALGFKFTSPGSILAPLVRFDTWTQAEIEVSKPVSFNRRPAIGDPILSADGRYAIFPSSIERLTANDTNSSPDVFVRDVAAGTTVLISVNRLGTQAGNRPSSTPTLAPDGRTVVFRSWATDLVSGQPGSMPDFYFLTLPTTDTDVDGMADDWEMAYFSTLDRDGLGDFDADGHSDREEFEAGTNPTNGQSVLRVLTLQKAVSGSVEVLWASEAGKLYELQGRDSVTEGEWISLGTVRATTTTQTWADPNPANPPHRFYRILVKE